VVEAKESIDRSLRTKIGGAKGTFLIFPG